jgi:hypothetical protein
MTIYGALVTKVYKDGSQWHVAWSSLHEDSKSKELVESQNSAVSSMNREYLGNFADNTLAI